jgi:hypothetical protein
MAPRLALIGFRSLSYKQRDMINDAVMTVLPGIIKGTAENYVSTIAGPDAAGKLAIVIEAAVDAAMKLLNDAEVSDGEVSVDADDELRQRVRTEVQKQLASSSNIKNSSGLP